MDRVILVIGASNQLIVSDRARFRRRFLVTLRRVCYEDYERESTLEYNVRERVHYMRAWERGNKTRRRLVACRLPLSLLLNHGIIMESSLTFVFCEIQY